MALKLLIEVSYATGQTGCYFRSTDTWLFIPEGCCCPVRGKDGPLRRGGEMDASARPGAANYSLMLSEFRDWCELKRNSVLSDLSQSRKDRRHMLSPFCGPWILCRYTESYRRPWILCRYTESYRRHEAEAKLTGCWGDEQKWGVR